MQVAQNRGDQRTRAHRRSSGFLGLDQSVNITQCQGVCDRDAEILARGLHPVGQPCHETSLFKPKGGESPYEYVVLRPHRAVAVVVLSFLRNVLHPRPAKALLQ
jgi:hypothetical protein